MRTDHFPPAATNREGPSLARLMHCRRANAKGPRGLQLHFLSAIPASIDAWQTRIGDNNDFPRNDRGPHSFVRQRPHHLLSTFAAAECTDSNGR
jgi:hypothetical protein